MGLDVKRKRTRGMWWLSLGLLTGPAVAEISPPRPTTAPAPSLIPVCVRNVNVQCGLLDRQGHWAVEPAYSALYPGRDGWLAERQGKTGLLDAEGKVLIEPRFSSIGRFDHGLASASLSRSVRGLSGYIDRQGNWIIPAQYFIAGSFSEGIAVTVRWIGGADDGHSECQYLRPDGEPAFRGKWTDCDAFQFGMAAVGRGPTIRTSENADRAEMALIDRNGTYLIPWGQRYRLTPLSADRVLEGRRGADRLLDRQGREVFRVPDEGFLSYAGEGRLFYSLKDGKRGLLDMQSGKPLVTPANGWTYTSDFSDGVAWVKDGSATPTAAWTLIDRQGRAVLKGNYESIGGFSAGAAAVSIGQQGWQLIDRQGKALTEARYRRMRPAWEWGPQSPRSGDVWAAEHQDTDGAVDWIDANGVRLASVVPLPCGISAVRNARDEVIWPRDVEAHCQLGTTASKHTGWDSPEGSGVDEARVMAVRVAKAREQVAGMANLRQMIEKRSGAELSTQQAIEKAPWQRGPGTVRLEGQATLTLPAGLRYLAPEYVPAVAPLFGERLPASDGVPTALIINNEQTVVLRLALMQHGRVAIQGPQLDPDSLKRRMEANLTGFAGVRTRGYASSLYASRSIDWLRQPRWDAQAHRMDWSYSDFVFGSGFRRTYVVNSVLLGRRSVVAIQSMIGGQVFGEEYAVLAQDALDRVTAGLRFDPGHAYTDAPPGEPAATLTLVGYITGAPAAAGELADTAATDSKDPTHPALWGLLLLLLLAGGGWGVLHFSRRP